MELNSVEGILFGSKHRQKALVIRTGRIGFNCPKILEGFAAIKVILSDGEVMIKVEDSVSVFGVVSHRCGQVPKQDTVGLDFNGVSDLDLAPNISDGLIIIATSQIGKKLHAKTCTPNWKNVPFFILFHSIFEDILSVLGPWSSDIEIGVAS